MILHVHSQVKRTWKSQCPRGNEVNLKVSDCSLLIDNWCRYSFHICQKLYVLCQKIIPILGCQLRLINIRFWILLLKRNVLFILKEKGEVVICLCCLQVYLQHFLLNFPFNTNLVPDVIHFVFHQPKLDEYDNLVNQLVFDLSAKLVKQFFLNQHNNSYHFPEIGLNTLNWYDLVFFLQG